MSWPEGPSGWKALRSLGLKRDVIRFTRTCHEEYGPICGVKLPGFRGCLVNDAELIRELFTRHFSRLRKWDMDEFDRILGKGLLTSHGKLWKRQRQIIQPAFTKKRVETHQGTIREFSQGMTENWGSEPVVRDIQDDMLMVTLQIAVKTLFAGSP